MNNNRKFFHDNESAKHALVPYRFKVHLNNDSKMIDDLLARGFQTCQSAYEKNDFEDCLSSNTFEVHTISPEHEGNCETVLFRELVSEGFGDLCVIDAVTLLDVCTKLTKYSDISLRILLPLNTVFAICEVLAQEGRHDIVNSIRDQHPIIACITDKRNQALYFANPSNKNKVLGDFISYTLNEITKGGDGSDANDADIEITIPRIEVPFKKRAIYFKV